MRFFRFRSKDDFIEAGELARQQHSAWLTRAIVEGKEKPYPRIPIRPIVTGGFSRLMTTQNGPQLAEQWWKAAFNRMERVENETT